MQKNKLVILILAIVTLMIVGVYLGSTYKMKSELKTDVKQHLYDQGYTDDDIQFYYTVTLQNTRAVVVTFADEIGVDYFYVRKSDETIAQIDVVDTSDVGTSKHIEK